MARNAILNALTRERPDRGSGDSALLAMLGGHKSHTGPDSDLLRLEYRREVFRWAARQVRKEFRQTTWDAFWTLCRREQNRPEKCCHSVQLIGVVTQKVMIPHISSFVVTLARKFVSDIFVAAETKLPQFLWF